MLLERIVLVSSLTLAACGSDPLPNLFSTEVEQMVLEVDYQQGAEPYTQDNIWSLFSANAQALFAVAQRTIIVPQTLGQMELMQDITQQEFTTTDLLTISRAYRDEFDTVARRAFHVLFLNGFLVDSGKRKEDVIGVSIEGTSIIAIFKPVLSQAANPLFVEQSSLVHEFGHAVGLVNLELPVTSDHHDAANGAHCTNRDCVMYYLHEGRADLMSFFRRYQLTKSPVLFGKECLDDAWAAGR